MKTLYLHSNRVNSIGMLLISYESRGGLSYHTSPFIIVVKGLDVVIFPLLPWRLFLQVFCIDASKRYRKL
jgi:hypothetical protein